MEGNNQEQNSTPSTPQQVSNPQTQKEQPNPENIMATQQPAISQQPEQATKIIQEKTGQILQQGNLSQSPNTSPSQNVNKPQSPQSPSASNPKPIAPNNAGQPSGIDKETLWYLDNYILLRDYYERTISRIAARCVRLGNIALEEYPHYDYILDVLQEISDTGNFVINHKELYPYVEKKMKGGVEALRKNLKEYEMELEKNSSPDMIKEDASAVAKMKAALGEIDIKDDPTKGAGMSMDALMDKLMKQNQVDTSQYESYDQNVKTPEINQNKPKPN